jgi:hypothetical protein
VSGARQIELETVESLRATASLAASQQNASASIAESLAILSDVVIADDVENPNQSSGSS